MNTHYTIEMRISTDKIPDVIRENLNKQFKSLSHVLTALRDIGMHYPLEIIRVKWIESDQEEVSHEHLSGDAFFALFAPTINLDL